MVKSYFYSEGFVTCIVFIIKFCIDQLTFSALQSADHVDFLAWKMYRHRTPMARPRPRLRLVHDVSENHPSISTIYYAASEIESTTTAAATTATTETEILKSETVVKFGHKFLKVVKKIRKN